LGLARTFRDLPRGVQARTTCTAIIGKLGTETFSETLINPRNAKYRFYRDPPWNGTLLEERMRYPFQKHIAAGSDTDFQTRNILWMFIADYWQADIE
jgi:hypothetical protein